MSRARVIFDCNVYVQAIAFERGASAELLRLAETGRFELVFSRDVVAEVTRVIQYDHVQALNPDATPERVRAMFDRLRYRGTLMRRPRHLFDYARDPDDEPYLDLAAASKADWLISHDRDILSLATGHSLFAKQFRQIVPALRIADSKGFLDELRRRLP
jgi:putative PIN family toxin of toxin-antitoxin system